MTDKEILAEVYRRLQSYDNFPARPIKDFIELEWQKRDEKEMVDQHNRNRNPKDWIVDVREMERHRGLEIGEDGTVKEIK